MTKDKVKLSKKVVLLFFITSFFIYNSSYSQCTNPDPTGSAAQTFCFADDPRVSALVASGGTIAWFDAPTGGNQYTSTAPLFSGTIYYADDISSGDCSPNRLAVTVTMYGDYPSDMDVFVGKCASTDPTIADLSVTGTNIEWYDAETGGTQLNLTDSLVDGTTYWAQQTEMSCTSLRFPTVVTIIDPLPPTVVPLQSFCSPPGVTVADLQGVGSNILWYDTDTSTTPLDPSTPLIDGEDYWGAQSSAAFPCESTVRAQTTVEIDQMVNAGTDSAYTVCEIDAITTDLFTLLGGTPDTTGSWSGPSALTGGHLGTYDPATNVVGTYTYTVNSLLGVCPSESANIVVTITQIPPPTTAQVTQEFCEIEGATVAELVATGTSLLWYDTETDTTPLNATDILVDGEDYWASQTDATSGCESASRVVVNVTIIAPPPPTTANANQEFCEIDAATVANLAATGDSIFWYADNTSTVRLNPTDALVDGEDYWATQIDAVSGCESATRLVVTATIIVILPPTTTVVNQEFCEIDNATVADLDATGTGIQWYDTDTDTTPIEPATALIDGEDYWATQIVGPLGCESVTRLQINVTIIVIPPPTTTETVQSFCEINDSTIADLAATGTSILWYATETDTTPLNTADLLVDGEDYWATQTDATYTCESTTRLVVTVAILTPPPPTTTVVNQEFCEIDMSTVADLAATGDGIIWFATETDTIPLNATDLLIDGEDYWASQTDTTSGCESATRLVVNATILVTPPPTTTNATQEFCEIAAPTVANLSATGDSIFWYADNTSNVRLNPTDMLVDGEDYWATQIDASTGCESVTRLVVTASIIVILPPTTTEVNQAFCEINNATVADLNVTGTSVVWYASETDTTPLNGTDPLVNGEDYWASQTDATSGCESVTRLVVNVTIQVILPPTTTEANQSFCEIDGSTIADLMATGTNLIWYATETDTTPLNATDLLVDGDDYWASQTDATSGCESASRLVVTVSIVMPPPPTTTEVNQQFCEIDGSTIADLMATGTNLIWYATETDTTPLNATDLLIDGEDYWATQTDATSGCESATRLVVNITILVTPPPSTTSTTQAFCEIDGATVADLTATGNSILWYDTAIATAPLNATDLLVDGEDYWASQTDATTLCESTMRLMVNVNLNAPLPPTTTEVNQVFCEIDAATVADLSVTGTSIIWYASETDTTPLNGTDPLVNGEDYWASQTDATSGCESASRLVVNVTITMIPPPSTTATSQAFCLKDYLPGTPTLADLVVTGASINWYDSETSTTPLILTDVLVDTEDYWASQTDATSGCESATRIAITVTLVALPAPTTSSSSQTFCLVQNATVSDLQVTGTNILWYDTDISTTPLNTTDALIDGEDYWATQSDNAIGCESVLRLTVTITIVDVAPPVISAPSQSFCAIDMPTVADIAITGNTVVWYGSETDTTPLNSTDILIDGEDYWAADTDSGNGCQSSVRVAATVTVTDPGTPTITSLGNEFCKIEDSTLGDLNANVSSSNGGTITWYDSYPNGNILSLTDALTEGTTYYAAESDSSGCSSANALSVTVTLEACDDYAIEIYDGFSPTGNGINDTFKIKNLKELYPNFKVEIFNRWGAKVYTQDSSKPDWDGTLDGKGELLPAGVYFVVVHFNEDGFKPVQERLYLSR